MTVMQALLDKAIAEKRNNTGEEVTEYNRMEAEFDANLEKVDVIERSERQAKRQAELSLKAGSGTESEIENKPGSGDENPDGKRSLEVFNRFCRSGIKELADPEVRALQADSDIYGGYIVPPQQWVSGLIQAVDNLVFMQSLSTVYVNVNAESLGQASLDNDPADPTWTKEIATGTEDSTMSFGKRELRPHPLAQLLKVSRKLIRVSNPSAEGIVRDRMAYKFAVVTENAYMNGTGSEQPLGLFAASSNGISTGRDVSTGNTATSIGADGLIEAKYTLKGQYHGSARWIFHRNAVKQIRKLKDGNGDYLWQRGLASDRPDSILDLPYSMSEYVPAIFTTGLYVGILGDFKFYYIAFALDMEIQRLEELYAATNQVGFIGRVEVDGMPVLEEAFVRVKLA